MTLEVYSNQNDFMILWFYEHPGKLWCKQSHWWKVFGRYKGGGTGGFTICGKKEVSEWRKDQTSESTDIQNQTKHPVLCLVLLHYSTEIFMSLDAFALSKLVERKKRKTACLWVRWSPDGLCTFQRWCLKFYGMWETLTFQKFSVNSMILLIC